MRWKVTGAKSWLQTPLGMSDLFLRLSHPMGAKPRLSLWRRKLWVMVIYQRVIWVPFTLNLQSKWSLHAYFCVGRCNPHRDKLHGLGHTSGTPKQKLQGLGPVPFHLFSSDKDYVNFW